MTQFLPYVPGTPVNHRPMAAARALLASVPAGTEIVFEERDLSAQNQRTLSAKVSNLAARSRGTLTARTQTDKDAGVVRAFLARVDVPSTLETTPLTVDVTPVVVHGTAEQVDQITTAVATKERGHAGRRRKGRGRPGLDVATQLQRVVDGDGERVQITNRKARGYDEALLRRQYKTKQTRLSAAARAAGYQIKTEVSLTSSTIALYARLVKS